MEIVGKKERGGRLTEEEMEKESTRQKETETDTASDQICKSTQKIGCRLDESACRGNHQ